MTVRPIAAAAAATALALALSTVPAAAAATPPDGEPGTGPGATRSVGPDDELPPRQPPIAPEAGGVTAPAPSRPEASPAAPAGPEDQAVLVQGYVKTASKDRLVLSAPGTTETLTLTIDPKTEVLSAEQDLSVEELKQGQLVRAALLPSGDELVAVVVEVMPGEPNRSPGAGPRDGPTPSEPRSPEDGAVPSAPRTPPAPATPPSGSGR